jgi:hypothetical protein
MTDYSERKLCCIFQFETNIEHADDDNWDDDFATAISPAILQLGPHLKPQDNFGGLLSADRLKMFASDSRNVSANYDDDYYDGELLTIKASGQSHDYFDQQEKTLRPTFKKLEINSKEPAKSHSRKHSRKLSRSTTAPVGAAVPAGPKSPGKAHFGNKFELPARPDLAFREQSVEDYSDLQVDNDNVFSNGLKKVSNHENRLFHCRQSANYNVLKIIIGLATG